MILAERAARLVSEIAVERLKLEVARLRRERFGASSERSARIDQLELTFCQSVCRWVESIRFKAARSYFKRVLPIAVAGIL